MKKWSIAVVLIGLAVISKAQTSDWKGYDNSRAISKTFNYTGFDKLNIKNVNGDITVQVGKSFAILVTIDSALLPKLETSINKEGSLTLELKTDWQEWYSKSYTERAATKITISLPEISVLKYSGNGYLVANDIVGRYFRLNTSGNGDIKLTGSIDELDMIRSGNGDVQAGKLVAKKAKITASGNGDVTINVTEALEANSSGNGDIINKGKALFGAGSEKSGNGQMITQQN